jgi:glutamate dehydrogenase
LETLARERKPIAAFNTNKLSKDGFRVLVEETNVRLPSGEVVTNGTNFRNTYHLRCPGQATAMMFVPCGGRPEAIDISNVGNLIHDGKSRLPYIVEGANL